MSSATHPLQLVAGPILWAVSFVLLYGGLSVGCSVAPPDPVAGARTWLNASLIVMTLGFVGVMLYWAYRCVRQFNRDRQHENHNTLISGIAAAAYLVSALVTSAIALPVLILPPCL